MLRRMSFTQLLEWMAYDQISPIGSRRGDWQAASICSAIMNAAAAQTGSKHRFSTSDFMLEFGKERAKVEPRHQTVEEMKFIARMYVAQSNADEKKKKRR